MRNTAENTTTMSASETTRVATAFAHTHLGFRASKKRHSNCP
jgi:hypothetical protein